MLFVDVDTYLAMCAYIPTYVCPAVIESRNYESLDFVKGAKADKTESGTERG
jgi:hypothetical protein